MHTFLKDKTGSDLARKGRFPTSFWINSMGEYGHTWPTEEGGVEETIGGSIRTDLIRNRLNLGPLDAIPDHELERAYRNARHLELIDPAEHAMWRAHDHLSAALGSDLWRFYAALEYGGNRPVEHRLDMTIEYILTPEQEASLATLVEDSQNAGSLPAWGVRIEEMHEAFDDPGKVQVSVDVDVRGRGVAEVADFQVRWLMLVPATWGLVSVL